MSRFGFTRALFAAAAALIATLGSSANAFATLAGEPPSKSWWDDVKFYGHVEAGVTFNPDDPNNGLNFGHLFTDEANEFLLNQLLLTVERPLDSSGGFDLGFKLQGMYGSDARYTHFLGEFDEAIDDRNQIDIVEAFLNLHLPVLTQGGVDVKVGQYVTLEGAEVIDAKGNYLYSHSYIFNFGIPFKHTGVLTTTHVSPTFDIYAGVDTGVNTTFGEGDNNDAVAFHGGFGLKFLNGNLSILATTHIGPETPDNDEDLRYLNDVTVIWKLGTKLTSITDLNFIRDDAADAEGYGVAQYFVYAVNDRLSAVIRGEIWRDDDAFFVAAFPGDLDFVHAQKGEPATVIGGGRTTYGAITAGLNIKPFSSKPLKDLVFRPEVRYDASLNDTTPFDDGTEEDQFTFGADVILPF